MTVKIINMINSLRYPFKEQNFLLNKTVSIHDAEMLSKTAP